jgi:hypothetical protein
MLAGPGRREREDRRANTPESANARRRSMLTTWRGPPSTLLTHSLCRAYHQPRAGSTRCTSSLRGPAPMVARPEAPVVGPADSMALATRIGQDGKPHASDSRTRLDTRHPRLPPPWESVATSGASVACASQPPWLVERAAILIFWRFFGDSVLRIPLARAKSRPESRGQRNRRSQVRILTGALSNLVFRRFERRSGHRRSTARARGIAGPNRRHRFSGDFLGEHAERHQQPKHWSGVF